MSLHTLSPVDDQNGKLVLKDPGNVRFAVDVDYTGTPGNPDDDQEVPDSFGVVRDSTGRNADRDRRRHLV